MVIPPPSPEHDRSTAPVFFPVRVPTFRSSMYIHHLTAAVVVRSLIIQCISSGAWTTCLSRECNPSSTNTHTCSRSLWSLLYVCPVYWAHRPVRQHPTKSEDTWGKNFTQKNCFLKKK